MTQTIRSIQSWSEQRQILSALTEIKQLLAGMGLPLSQSPRPPTALSIKGELFRGKQWATVTIVEDADFECSYCRQFEHEVYPQISKDYVQTGKVKYFYCDLPLSTHPHAMNAARAARCAGEQPKFWEMHDSPFDEQNAIRDVDIPGRAQELGLDTTKFSACLSSDRCTDEINESSAEPPQMGIDGTPTFFIGKAILDSTVTDLKTILGVAP